jgi:uncharacterized protein
MGTTDTMSSMVGLVEDRVETLKAACERFGVARLEVFGSASDPNTFDPDRSDVDFLVSFRPGTNLGPWLATYFDLRDELEQILGRRVDLVMEGAVRNQLFAQQANRTRQLVYAAKDSEAA